jgi:hypothetical protein
MYGQYIQGLCQSRLGTAGRALTHVAHVTAAYSLDGRTLAAAKFKPFIFSVSGFALPSTANIVVLMILYDRCLLPAQF